jgi:hypothetical protein
MQLAIAGTAGFGSQFSEHGFDVAEMDVRVDRVGEKLVQDLAVAVIHGVGLPRACCVETNPSQGSHKPR